MIEPKFFKQTGKDYDPTEIIRTGFALVGVGAGQQGYFDEAVSTIAFLLEGEVKVTATGSEPQTIRAGQMAVVPSGLFHLIETQTPITAVFLYVIGNVHDFCDRVTGIDCLANLTAPTQQLQTLPMATPVDTFARQIADYISNSRFALDLSRTKQQELATLLSSYYSHAEMAQFLAPLYHSPRTFYSRVMELGDLYLTVEEMADRLHLSQTAFQRRFKETFNMPPKTWRIRRRCIMLYRALREGSEPISDLVEKFHFSTPQQLSSFCSTHLGGSPSDIRGGRIAPPSFSSANRATQRRHTEG